MSRLRRLGSQGEKSGGRSREPGVRTESMCFPPSAFCLVLYAHQLGRPARSKDAAFLEAQALRLYLPTLRSSQASNVSRGPDPRKRHAKNVAPPGPNGSTPSGSGNLQGTPSVGGGHKPRALARRLTDYPPLTLSGFIGCEGRLRYGALGKNTKKFETTLPASTSAIPRWIEAKDSS